MKKVSDESQKAPMNGLDDDVDILFQTKKNRLMIGYCTVQAVIATKILAGKK